LASWARSAVACRRGSRGRAGPGALGPALQRTRFQRPGASALTAAELRLLPLLSTHLSFPQIAGELFLSRHTIKSQAMSIYRKLGVSSRSVQLGLLAG
jgi:LuxR family maltose regulon positive regulatory protein